MSTSNTPLTDAVAKAIGRHLADYASRRSEGQRGTLGDTAFDIGVELETIRTLETRLRAAEELLRELYSFPRVRELLAPAGSLGSLSDRIAAHLAEADKVNEDKV